jgi:hypothetical protein
LAICSAPADCAFYKKGPRGVVPQFELHRSRLAVGRQKQD